MRICIIGGTGFIGYYVSQECLRRGHDVTILGRRAPTPANLFTNVTIALGNYMSMSDDELFRLFIDQQAVIFAIRIDDNKVHKAPAYDAYNRPHVHGCERIFRLAREAGVKRGVVVGSYLTYFNRIWPELHLTRDHLYIRARQEQAEAALAAAAPSMDMMILEMPYVMGAVPGRVSRWAPLVQRVNSSRPLFYTAGGSNMIAVTHASEAIVGAVEKGKGGEWYTIGEKNMTWVAFLNDIAKELGVKKRVITVPRWVSQLYGYGIYYYDSLHGLERGFNPAAFMAIQTRELFYDPTPSRTALGYGQGDLAQAIRDIVRASIKP